MRLLALHNLCPPYAFSQKDIWAILENHAEVRGLKPQSQSLLKRILLGDSGIQSRTFCTEDPKLLFSANAQMLNEQFEKAAPELGLKTLAGALEKAKLKAEDLDALFVCTCTGYLCPGLSSYIAEGLDMRPNAYLLDIVGQGCGAALPTLGSIQNFLTAHPHAKAACVAVEVCSSAFFLDNDPGVLISLCLFGDGASASIWGGSIEENASFPYCKDFDTIHLPKEREKLRFVNHQGKLRNSLHRDVPDLAAEAVGILYERNPGVVPRSIATHSGGKKVLQAIEKRLPQVELSPAWDVLTNHGNMSSPSVLFALERALEAKVLPKKIWITTFGAGISCHSCSLHIP